MRNFDRDFTKEGYLMNYDHFNDLGVTAIYHYDYGDSWVHTVKLEGYIFREKDQEYPCCIGVARPAQNDFGCSTPGRGTQLNLS
ncbi:MAG: hypothetical protein GQ565_07085 [Candidatus Aegiribacteria sp.]|nr:hypothetical protein [Candidatus Aegiribacteria sp.]